MKNSNNSSDTLQKQVEDKTLHFQRNLKLSLHIIKYIITINRVKILAIPLEEID